MTSFRLFMRRGTRRAAASLVAAAALLASCGGGTSQYDPFVPERLFAFGDDASALRNDGRNWAINGLNTSNVFDCSLAPIWVQSLASLYNFVFAECNPGNVAQPQARTFAVVGARVADIGAQIDAQVAAGGFGAKDISTLLVGANDILALYAQYPNRTEAELLAEATALGERTAQHVNRLIGLGTKVIVSNLPDLGMTPYALAERAANTDIDRAALISRLTAAFNQQLGVKIILDGRYVGLVQMDQRSLVIGRSPISFGFADITRAACASTAPLPDCTTGTLVTDANASTWLWADDRRLSPGGHSQIATLAIDRARRNPF